VCLFAFACDITETVLNAKCHLRPRPNAMKCVFDMSPDLLFVIWELIA